MTRPVASGLEGVPSEGLAHLGWREKRAVVKNAETGAFSPQVVAAYIGQSHEPPLATARKVIDKTLSVPNLAGGAVISQAAVKLAPAGTYVGPDLPPILYSLAESLAHFTPGALIPESPALAYAVPGVLAAGTLAKAATSLKPTALFWQRTSVSRKGAKATIERRLSKGTMAWENIFGMAYTGDGSLIYDSLVNMDPRNYCEASFVPKVEPGYSVNVALPEKANAVKAKKVYRRAGIMGAKIVILTPSSIDNEIYPDVDSKKSFIYGVARAASVYRRVDEICKSAELPLLPGLVIGDPEQPLDYRRLKNGRHEGELIHRTLESHMATVSAKRGVEIKVLDATKVVMDEVIKRADGRPVELVTTAINDHMQQQFFKRIGKHRFKTYLSPLIVYLNFSDRSTEHSPEFDLRDHEGSIVILKDPYRAAGMIDDGTEREDIIIAPELIAHAALKEVNRLTATTAVKLLSPVEVERLAADPGNNPLSHVLCRAKRLADNRQNK